MKKSVLAEVDDLAARVTARMTELKPLADEYNELRSAAERLGISEPDTDLAPSPQAARASADFVALARKSKRAVAKPKPRRRGRPPSTRKDDVLRIVREFPGSTVAEVGRALNTDATALYRYAKDLTTTGLLRKDGALYFPVEQPELPPVD